MVGRIYHVGLTVSDLDRSTFLLFTIFWTILSGIQLDELYQWFTDTYGLVVELKMNLKSVWIYNSICSFSLLNFMKKQKFNVTSFLRVALKKLARKLVRKKVKKIAFDNCKTCSELKDIIKEVHENGMKLDYKEPKLYDVVSKEEIAEFEEVMRKTIADIVSEASGVACWVYVQKYVKHKTLDEMLQEWSGASKFILAMDTWFESLMADQQKLCQNEENDLMCKSMFTELKVIDIIWIEQIVFVFY